MIKILNSEHVLVTGGAGFLGSSYVAHLLDLGAKVTALDDFSRGDRSRLNLEWLRSHPNSNNLTVIRGDIRDHKIVQESLKGHDAVIHAAAQVSVPVSVDAPRLDFETNALGTFNVLEAARNSKEDPIVINISSNKIYGATGGELVELGRRYDFKDLPNGVDEEAPINALEPYGISKATGDLYASLYYQRYGIRTTSLRFSLIYGPRQWGSEEQGFVAWFCVAQILRLPIRIFGNGKQVRDLLYITDAISAVDLAVSHIHEISGRSLNIGGGKENSVSLLQLLEYITTSLSKNKNEVIFSNWRERDVKCFYTRYQLAHETLGWEPKVGWTQGVLNLYIWLLMNIDAIKTLYQH